MLAWGETRETPDVHVTMTTPKLRGWTQRLSPPSCPASECGSAGRLWRWVSRRPIAVRAWAAAPQGSGGSLAQQLLAGSAPRGLPARGPRSSKAVAQRPPSVPSYMGLSTGRLGHGSPSTGRNSEEARGRGLTRWSHRPSSPDLGRDAPSLLPCSVGGGMSPGPAPVKEKESHAARTPGGGGSGGRLRRLPTTTGDKKGSVLMPVPVPLRSPPTPQFSSGSHIHPVS